ACGARPGTGQSTAPPPGELTPRVAAGVAAVRKALRQHWPEYLMEASGLGLFVLAACVFASLLEHPDSLLRQAVADPDLRRALFGLAAGMLTAGIVYSPWGQQSGALLNPAVTLTFFRLGYIEPWDQCFY